MQESHAPRGALHIIPIGEDESAVSVGLQHYPVGAMAFIHLPSDKKRALQFKEKFSILGVDMICYELEGNPLTGMFHAFQQILQNCSSNQNVIVNVGAAGKHVACAAISASFVNGLSAFHVMDGMLVPLPIMKFSYKDQLSENKEKILRSLENNNGHAEDMNDLVEWTGLSKSLLSYHLRGNDENHGLEELGFVDLERGKSGRLSVNLSSMGQMVLIGR